MQGYSTTEEGRLEELILSLRPRLELLARRYAKDSYRVEYEELLSIGTLRACEAYAHAKVNPAAYMMKCAEGAMLDEVLRVSGRRKDTVSLDAPLGENSSSSLTDVLLDCSSLISDSSSRMCAVRVRAVRRAVKRLPPRRRAAVLYFYGFEGYGEHESHDAGRVLGISGTGVRSHTSYARQDLRQDAELCEAVGVVQ
jgi:DNA-directed RNA polymerase specialized sigma24 family protein